MAASDENGMLASSLATVSNSGQSEQRVGVQRAALVDEVHVTVGVHPALVIAA